MNRNEVKKLNGVELDTKYQEIKKELLNLKNKMLLMKSLEVANGGVGICSIVFAVKLMCNYHISKEALLILIAGILNIAIADNNYDIIQNVDNLISQKNDDKEVFEKEIRVRNFIKKRNGLYQI